MHLLLIQLLIQLLFDQEKKIAMLFFRLRLKSR